MFLFSRALCGASVSHTLIKSRHLIDTPCKVLRRWTKRTGLFYSPVDLVLQHMPAVCVHLSGLERDIKINNTRMCLCLLFSIRFDELNGFTKQPIPVVVL